MEVKRNVYIGETGNKATVTEEEGNIQSLEAEHAKVLMREAGRLYTPIGFEHMGSATVHFYKKDGILGPEFIHVCQTDVKNVVENHADLGHKALKTAFMRSYGRKEPKGRT